VEIRPKISSDCEPSPVTFCPISHADIWLLAVLFFSVTREYSHFPRSSFSIIPNSILKSYCWLFCDFRLLLSTLSQDIWSISYLIADQLFDGGSGQNHRKREKNRVAVNLLRPRAPYLWTKSYFPAQFLIAPMKMAFLL
jgi:hypothetical protein